MFDLQKAGRGHELRRRRIRRWMAYKIVIKLRIYLKPFSCGPPTRRTHTRTHTHIHTHIHESTIAIGENATTCISLKNAFSQWRFFFNNIAFCFFTHLTVYDISCKQENPYVENLS